MSARRGALGAAVVLTALLAQTGVLSRLPGPTPELLLLVVLAFAVAEGPTSGVVTGFIAGLLVDVSAPGELGRVALAYALAGYVAGVVTGPDRSRLSVLGAVAAGAALAVTAYALEGVLLADPRTTFTAWAGALATTVAGCVLLAPVVVPIVGVLVRRLYEEPRR